MKIRLKHQARNATRPRMGLRRVEFARRQLRSRQLSRCDYGFTLIELLVVITILPLIVGGIAAALVAVLQNQSTTSAQYTNSVDAQITSARFVRDVQSAQYVTTDATITSPYSSISPQICGVGAGGSLISAMYWQSSAGIYTEVTYWEVGTSLIRRLCTVNGSWQTPSVSASAVVASNFPAGQASAVVAPIAAAAAAAAGWYSAVEVSGVTISVTEPGKSAFQYGLLGIPRIWNSVGAGFPGGGSPPPPFLVLGNSADCSTPALSESGAAVVTISAGNAPIGIDSTCPGAISLGIPRGSPSLLASSVLTANPNYATSPSVVVGGGVTQFPSTETYSASGPIADPYATLVAPTNPTSGATGSCPSTNGGTCTSGVYGTSPTLSNYTWNFATSGIFIFTNAVSITNAAIVNFGAGTYWFEGGLTINGNTTVNFGSGLYIFGDSLTGTGNGITISNGAVVNSTGLPGGMLWYVEGGSASIVGNGQVSLNGSPQYDGLAIWDVAAQGTTDPLTITNGGSVSDGFGGIYAPNGEVIFSGAGSAGVSSLVVEYANLSNGGTLTVGSSG